jgi:hypothetical protein
VIFHPFSRGNKHRPVFYFSDEFSRQLFIEHFDWCGRIKFSPKFSARHSLL